MSSGLPISRKDNRRARVNIGILAILVLGYLWGFFAYWASTSKEQLFNGTEQELSVKSKAIRQYAHDLFKVAGIFQTTTERWLESNPSRDPRTDRTFARLIEDLRQQTNELIEIRLVDAAGAVFYLPSERQTIKTTPSEQEFIRASLRSTSRQPLIGSPTLPGAGGQARLAITSKMRGSYSGFEAINASVNIENLLAFLESERIKPNGTITLWRTDGTVVAKISARGVQPSQADNLSSFELQRILRQNADVSLNYRNTGDGLTEVVTYSRLSNFPLIISMTASVGDTLEVWQRHRNTIMSLLAIATLVIGLLSVRLVNVLGMLEQDAVALEKLATTDALTGLYNRRHFLKLCDVEIDRAHRYGEPFSLLILDVDFFKKINDTWGHPAGDRVLQDIGQAFGSIVRTPDICARIGGEEFAVALPNTDAQGADLIAERIRSGIAARSISIGEKNDSLPGISITVSIGVTSFMKGDDFEAMLGRADKALYRAKQSGRNQVQAE